MMTKPNPQRRWVACLCGYQQPRTDDKLPAYCPECKQMTLGAFDK